MNTVGMIGRLESMKDCIENGLAAWPTKEAVEKHSIELGEMLLAVKAVLAHGQFHVWLDERFPRGKRTAQRYMRLARQARRKANEKEAQGQAAGAVVSAGEPGGDGGSEGSGTEGAG